MLRALFAGVLLGACSGAYALDDESFKFCVKVKDMTVSIAEQADKGASRDDLKSMTTSAGVRELIDFVYDFRGAKSNQEIAAKSMERCLVQMQARSKRK